MRLQWISCDGSCNGTCNAYCCGVCSGLFNGTYSGFYNVESTLDPSMDLAMDSAMDLPMDLPMDSYEYLRKIRASLTNTPSDRSHGRSFGGEIHSLLMPDCQSSLECMDRGEDGESVSLGVGT